MPALLWILPEGKDWRIQFPDCLDAPLIRTLLRRLGNLEDSTMPDPDPPQIVPRVREKKNCSASAETKMYFPGLLWGKNPDRQISMVRKSTKKGFFPDFSPPLGWRSGIFPHDSLMEKPAQKIQYLQYHTTHGTFSNFGHQTVMGKDIRPPP